MASSEYQREYRLNNPDKYLIWDKNSRERRKLKMQTDILNISKSRKLLMSGKRCSNGRKQ